MNVAKKECSIRSCLRPLEIRLLECVKKMNCVSDGSRSSLCVSPTTLLRFWNVRTRGIHKHMCHSSQFMLTSPRNMHFVHDTRNLKTPYSKCISSYAKNMIYYKMINNSRRSGTFSFFNRSTHWPGEVNRKFETKQCKFTTLERFLRVNCNSICILAPPTVEQYPMRWCIDDVSSIVLISICIY